MSLDVYLSRPYPPEAGTGIFVVQDDREREVTFAEFRERFPGCEPSGKSYGETLYDGNITHNLGKMAGEAGIYEHLWRPEEIGVAKAEQLVHPLSEGLKRLEAEPHVFQQFDAPNGWGKHEHLVRFVREYLAACREYPDADVKAWR